MSSYLIDTKTRILNATWQLMELLDRSVEVWGNYIPEIYGLAKALLIARETDDATAAAWDDCSFV